MLATAFAFAIGLAVAGAAVSAAPPRAAADETLDALVAELDAPSYARREAASQRLLETPNAAASLVERLASGELSPEQRQRLLTIVARQVESTPRGALGIRMETLREIGQGVVVSGFVENMPAAAVLRVGDRIVTVEHVAIGGASDLIDVVQRRLPGETVRLGVVRGEGEEVIELAIVLGSVEQLQQDAADPLMRQNPVLIERARQVADLRQRFGAAPLRVIVAESPADADGEHPELRRTRLHLEAIAAGGVVDPERIRRRVLQRLQRLRRDAVDPRLPESERLRLREAIVQIEAMLSEER